ncbi:hypothetical protein MMC10_010269 [Thelotrema lepadinum]|nr:hypothetical protein [Thelotrema lepadinum]
MPNPPLAYGLNVPKKPSLASRLSAQPKRKTIFDDDSGGEEDEEANGNGEEAIDTFDAAGQRPTIKPKSQSKNLSSSKKPPLKNHNVDLASAHSAKKQVTTAQELDSKVYEYDSVYDSLHAKPAKANVSTGPKYMTSLLAAAEVRKRDQLRAKEKMLAKEREAEGEEYADKEKFVTGAYKAQQEEVKRLEAEEREKEKKEVERKRKTGGGMTGLYRGLLEREEARHDAAIKAVEDVEGQSGEGGREEEEKGGEGKSEAELAREKGAVVNDEGQVVDKRQLLSAGLNVRAKPKLPVSKDKALASAGPSESMAILQGRSGNKAAMRERQSRMLEEQLAEASKRVADNKEVEQEALERAAKSKKTGGEISSARERYLQRKREADAAKAAGKEP